MGHVFGCTTSFQVQEMIKESRQTREKLNKHLNSVRKGREELDRLKTEFVEIVPQVQEDIRGTFEELRMDNMINEKKLLFVKRGVANLHDDLGALVQGVNGARKLLANTVADIEKERQDEQSVEWRQVQGNHEHDTLKEWKEANKKRLLGKHAQDIHEWHESNKVEDEAPTEDSMFSLMNGISIDMGGMDVSGFDITNMDITNIDITNVDITNIDLGVTSTVMDATNYLFGVASEEAGGMEEIDDDVGESSLPHQFFTAQPATAPKIDDTKLRPEGAAGAKLDYRYNYSSHGISPQSRVTEAPAEPISFPQGAPLTYKPTGEVQNGVKYTMPAGLIHYATDDVEESLKEKGEYDTVAFKKLNTGISMYKDYLMRADTAKLKEELNMRMMNSPEFPEASASSQMSPSYAIRYGQLQGSPIRRPTVSGDEPKALSRDSSHYVSRDPSLYTMNEFENSAAEARKKVAAIKEAQLKATLQ